MKFVNIVDSDISKVLEFCHYVEDEFNDSILTGINFAHTKDDKALLGLVFADTESYDKALEHARSLAFERVYTEEEDWLAIGKLSKFCMVGNFSYKLAGE